MAYRKHPKTVTKARGLSVKGSQGVPTRLEQLSEQQYSKMLTYVRAGAFREQAAKMIGIRPQTLLRYLQQGEEDIANGEPTIFSRLVIDFEQATSEARIVAEIDVRKNQPLHWLKYAARSNAYEPGWNDDTRHIVHEHIGNEQHPITIETRDKRSETMAHALTLLRNLGMDPTKLLEQRPPSVFDATATEIIELSSTDPVENEEDE